MTRLRLRVTWYVISYSFCARDKVKVSGLTSGAHGASSRAASALAWKPRTRPATYTDTLSEDLTATNRRAVRVRALAEWRLEAAAVPTKELRD